MIVFRKPGLFLTWGIKNGDFTPESIVDQAAAAGFKWIAQEYGDPNTQPPDDLIARLRSECHNKGIYYGIWEVSPQSLDTLNAVKPDLWILNVEAPGDWYAQLLKEFRIQHPLLPAGVITNCALDPKPFIAANVKAMPEAYQVDDPSATPINMVNLCHSMGWRQVFPTLGVYHDYPASNYSLAGTGYSIYMVEGMNPVDWDTATKWNSTI